MTNVGNEYGQILNSVLTTGEGVGLDDLCQGIVQRYKAAGEPQPEAIYVDRDCCSDRGVLSSNCVLMFIYEYDTYWKRLCWGVTISGN